jgi:hypothetical protein
MQASPPPLPLQPWAAVPDGLLRSSCCGETDFFVRLAAATRDVTERFELLQCFDRRVHHVQLVGAADALRQDVFHAGGLDHRANRATRDNAGTGTRGAKQYFARTVVAMDHVRNRVTIQ